MAEADHHTETTEEETPEEREATPQPAAEVASMTREEEASAEA